MMDHKSGFKEKAKEVIGEIKELVGKDDQNGVKEIMDIFLDICQ